MKRFAVLVAIAILTIFSGRAQGQKARHELRATAAAHSVTLTLTASPTPCVSACVMTYEIYRGTAAGAEDMAAPINPAPLTAANLSFTDTNVSLGNTYYYVAQAVETSGTLVLTSASSAEVSATFPQAPAPPGLAAKPN